MNTRCFANANVSFSMLCVASKSLAMGEFGGIVLVGEFGGIVVSTVFAFSFVRCLLLLRFVLSGCSFSSCWYLAIICERGTGGE